jgi:hypothetical protein
MISLILLPKSNCFYVSGSAINQAFIASCSASGYGPSQLMFLSLSSVSVLCSSIASWSTSSLRWMRARILLPLSLRYVMYDAGLANVENVVICDLESLLDQRIQPSRHASRITVWVSLNKQNGSFSLPPRSILSCQLSALKYSTPSSQY